MKCQNDCPSLEVLPPNYSQLSVHNLESNQNIYKRWFLAITPLWKGLRIIEAENFYVRKLRNLGRKLRNLGKNMYGWK